MNKIRTKIEQYWNSLDPFVQGMWRVVWIALLFLIVFEILGALK